MAFCLLVIIIINLCQIGRTSTEAAVDLETVNAIEADLVKRRDIEIITEIRIEIGVEVETRTVAMIKIGGEAVTETIEEEKIGKEKRSVNERGIRKSDPCLLSYCPERGISFLSKKECLLLVCKY